VSGRRLNGLKLLMTALRSPLSEKRVSLRFLEFHNPPGFQAELFSHIFCSGFIAPARDLFQIQPVDSSGPLTWIKDCL
jgi:hypothetical protein